MSVNQRTYMTAKEGENPRIIHKGRGEWYYTDGEEKMQNEI